MTAGVEHVCNSACGENSRTVRLPCTDLSEHNVQTSVEWNASEANLHSHYLLSSLTLLPSLFPFPPSPDPKLWLMDSVSCVCVPSILPEEGFPTSISAWPTLNTHIYRETHTHTVMVCVCCVISWNHLNFPSNCCFSSELFLIVCNGTFPLEVSPLKLVSFQSVSHCCLQPLALDPKPTPSYFTDTWNLHYTWKNGTSESLIFVRRLVWTFPGLLVLLLSTEICFFSRRVSGWYERFFTHRR